MSVHWHNVDISVVIVLDQLVKPKGAIVDYLTK